MVTFEVNDMTCGHCVSTITKAIRGADKDAKVTVDLAQHLVMVEPTAADAQDLSDAITEAGYAPVLVEAATMAAKPAKAGGCCGCCG
ncbi:MAG: heavy-metal-associated domain-containing protein [Vitreoscilla sp.]|nr:heavy-metal-associated domain-containing protein [Vitreoscilla sp.]